MPPRGAASLAETAQHAGGSRVGNSGSLRLRPRTAGYSAIVLRLKLTSKAFVGIHAPLITRGATHRGTTGRAVPIILELEAAREGFIARSVHGRRSLVASGRNGYRGVIVHHGPQYGI